MKIRTHVFRPVISLAALVFSSQAALAAPGDVPSSAEGSRVHEQIAPSQSPKLSVAPAKVSTSGGVKAPAGAEKVKFKLKSVDIDGMIAYNKSAVAYLYKDKIGTVISLADVYDLADKLTVKYRNEGYILSQVVVPPQTIESGEIKLRVVEGFVGNVTIQGDTRQHTEYLQGFADRIKATRPLNAKALERYLLLINDLPGVSARAVLSPSKTAGASDVTLVVEQKSFDTFLQADNRGSRFLGPIQLNGSMRFNNAFGLYEGINAQVVTAPDRSSDHHRELDYVGLTWSEPVNYEGTMVSVGGNITSTYPGFALKPFQTHGLAKAFNLGVSHPLIRSRSRNLFLHGTFDYLNSHRIDNLGLGPTVDRLRVLRGGGTYQFTDGWLGINTIDAELSHGMGILDASAAGDLGLTRPRGDPQFTKATFTATRIQRLTNIMEGFLSAKGQRSSHILLASEEFGVGGQSFGSAYDNSEITGEHGLAGRVELRANNPAPEMEQYADFTQVYGFYDIGKVWDIDNAVPGLRRRSIASTGAGTRVTVNENFSGNLEVAVPLTRRPATTDDEGARVFGAVTARF